MKKSLSLAIGIFFFLISFGKSSVANAAEVVMEKDLYQKIYEELDVKPYELALERVAAQRGIEAFELALILQNPTDNYLSKICTIVSSSDFLKCLEGIQLQFEEEKARILDHEIGLFYASACSEQWANGTLEDSSFDIIVDLNIIDVILFGPNATVPTPRLPGYVLEDTDYQNVRRSSELVDPLKRPENTRNGPGNIGNTDGGSGDGNPDTENDGDVSNPGSDEDPLMCVDPDALFFAGDNSNKEDQDSGSDGEGNGDGSGGQGHNVSTPPRELPDLSGKKDDFRRGVYPNLDDLEESETCGDDEQEVPLFHGMFCVPRFCDDILCVFVNIKPGRAFTLAPQEIPACVECIVEKGYEILTTLEKTVETPQSASNKRYAIPNPLALFGKPSMKFSTFARSLPEDPKNPEDEKSLMKVFDEPDNYKLADMILNHDCQAVLDLLPDDAVVSNSEVLEWCTKYQKSPQDIKNILPDENKNEEGEKITTTEEITASNLRDEFTTGLYSYLESFQKSITAFTNAAQFSTEQIEAVDISCPAS